MNNNVITEYIMKKGGFAMTQQYYCKHCCTLLRKKHLCPACGKKDYQPIIITVHRNFREKVL